MIKITKTLDKDVCRLAHTMKFISLMIASAEKYNHSNDYRRYLVEMSTILKAINAVAGHIITTKEPTNA